VERESGTLLDGFDAHLGALIEAQQARPRNLGTLRTGIMAMGMASTVGLGRAQALAPAGTVRLRHHGGQRRHFTGTHGRAGIRTRAPGRRIRNRVIDPANGQDCHRRSREIVVRAFVMQGYKKPRTARP
jgi:hypothetical protein